MDVIDVNAYFMLGKVETHTLFSIYVNKHTQVKKARHVCRFVLLHQVHSQKWNIIFFVFLSCWGCQLTDCHNSFNLD